MPFRQQFACLWCGQDWTVRSDQDLEGWAALCPECLGRADDNGFLRNRLRTALRDRAAAATPDPAPGQDAPTEAQALDLAPEHPTDGPAAAHDDWYLRRGRFSRGPLHDGPWEMELDEVTRWLDGSPISGTIVELAAGTGWWSTLLAEKGELWVYDPSDAALEAARKRLVAHGLLAHLHERDPLAAPDKRVDVVFAAYLLSAAQSETQLQARIGVASAWLASGGMFVFIEAGSPAGSGPIDGPAGPLWPRDVPTLRDPAAGSRSRRSRGSGSRPSSTWASPTGTSCVVRSTSASCDPKSADLPSRARLSWPAGWDVEVGPALGSCWGSRVGDAEVRRPAHDTRKVAGGRCHRIDARRELAR